MPLHRSNRRGFPHAHRIAALIAGTAAALPFAATSHAQTPLTKTNLAGFSGGLAIASPPRDFHRIFVVEQPGRIRLVKDGVVQPTLFLDITPLVNSTTWLEWGLLGLAFHPDYANNGYFYVNYTDQSGTTVIARYTVSANPDIADPTTAQIVLTITHTNREHRAGWLAFGPDGYLYDSQGDGGPEGDPLNKGQNLTILDAKILRVDVDHDDFPLDPTRNYAIPPSNPFAASTTAMHEIWAYGLRNPWRCSFDRVTGDLWIGDVGQSAREEIDVQDAGDPGPRNYGWPCTEGISCRNMTQCICNAPELTPPIYDYPRAQGVSVTGGHVYRGCAVPDLQGHYFFADWGSHKIWSFTRSGSTVANFTDRTPTLGGGVGSIRAFGEDALGELYFTDGAALYKIIPVSLAGPDCNHNNIADACDIASGTSQDLNHNGIPDECEGGCYANCDGSTTPPALNINDFLCFQSAFAAGASYANCDGSTTPPILNVNDFLCFQSAFATGCP